MPDRSHSPPERARGGPHARERGDVSVSPNRDAGRNMLQLHHQVLGIMAEAKVSLGLLEARVEGLLPGVTLVECPGSMVVLLILMELGTISVVPVSMVLPTEVALATKGLALAVVSPTMLQVTPQVLQAVVMLGQVLASATV